MQQTWLDLGHALTAAEHIYDFTEEFGEGVCELLGDYFPCNGAGVGIICIPNGPKFICKHAKLLLMSIGFAVLTAATIAYQVVDGDYEIATLGEK